jgi:hypothetical protein
VAKSLEELNFVQKELRYVQSRPIWFQKPN